MGMKVHEARNHYPSRGIDHTDAVRGNAPCRSDSRDPTSLDKNVAWGRNWRAGAIDYPDIADQCCFRYWRRVRDRPSDVALLATGRAQSKSSVGNKEQGSVERR